MASSLATARRSLARLGDRGRTTRIPDEVRAAVLRYAMEARSAGETWQTIGERVGLASTAVQRWHRAMDKPSKLVPVIVANSSDSVGSSDLVLVTPHGERLEGLELDDAVRIVRALR